MKSGQSVASGASIAAKGQLSTQALQPLIDHAVDEVGRHLLGKEHQIRLALCCLFSRGHLLIEDLPGMGKTTLSHALAAVLGKLSSSGQIEMDLETFQVPWSIVVSGLVVFFFLAAVLHRIARASTSGQPERDDLSIQTVSPHE